MRRNSIAESSGCLVPIGWTILIKKAKIAIIKIRLTEKPNVGLSFSPSRGRLRIYGISDAPIRKLWKSQKAPLQTT